MLSLVSSPDSQRKIMSNVEIYDERIAGSEASDPQDTGGNGERTTQSTIVDKIAAAINARPPVIGELTQAETQGIEIRIPLGGDAWKELSRKTGVKTTHGMKERLREIALRENLDITFGTDDDGIGDTVKIIKKQGISYEKFMDGEGLAFIGCFEFHAVRL